MLARWSESEVVHCERCDDGICSRDVIERAIYSDLARSTLLNRHIFDSNILFAIVSCGAHVGVEVPEPKSCSISPVMTEFTNAASSAHISSEGLYKQLQTCMISVALPDSVGTTGKGEVGEVPAVRVRDAYSRTWSADIPDVHARRMTASDKRAGYRSDLDPYVRRDGCREQKLVAWRCVETLRGKVGVSASKGSVMPIEVCPKLA
jgi:hypothetical protein